LTGHVSIVLAFALALYSIVVSIYGARSGRREYIDSARNATGVLFFLITVASFSLLVSLWRLDFSLKYVAANTSLDLPHIYRVTALWAGQAGSLLLWSWILSGYMALLAWRSRSYNSPIIAYAIAVLSAVMAFFLYLNGFVEDPFERLPFTPVNGRGMNPLLQNIYMAIHPLSLYLGYVGVAVPYALAMGALLSRRLDDEWIRLARRWMLAAWFFLALGLLLGARWAYLELGWGGYWAWDPVENAAFMPWLTATAFIHSVMIQEKKGMLKKWNMTLVIVTFFLALFGTFITRSGIISSVHSFAQSDIGPYFLSLLAAVLLFSFYWVARRMDDLATENTYESFVSRESAFLVNNLLFLGAAFAVFLGTVFPIISEVVSGDKILVGPPYFNRVTVPIGLVMILLMGVGPLVSWRKSTPSNLVRNFLVPTVVGGVTVAVLVALGVRGVSALASFGLCAFVFVTIVVEFWRGLRVRLRRGEGAVTALMRLVSKNKRRYGGYIVHLGIVLIVVGVTASSTFSTRREVLLRRGESVTLGGYTLTYLDLERRSTAHKNSTIATLAVEKGGKRLGVLRPESNLFNYQGNRAINKETEVALRSTFRDDLYVILTRADLDGGATFVVLLNPMVSWIWAGGLVVVLGAVITMMPSVLDRRREVAVRYSVVAPEGEALES